MHHHKSTFSRKRSKDGHGRKKVRHHSHDCADQKGSSRKNGRCMHQMSDFIKSRHELFYNRKGMFHRLENNASPMTDPSIEKIPMEDRGLRLSVDLERCVRCGKCEKVCPTGAIMVDEDIFRVDSSLCNGCGRCVDGCREAALSLRENQDVFMNGSSPM